ncbi:ASPD dehydrogenase, partial [Quiscalus mexicanus]|nr:ASPD dehydrogenase [Quiscalus mexicanus]
GVDLVVEVAHPCVTQEHGEDILGHADLMVTPRTWPQCPQTPHNVPNVPKSPPIGDNDNVPVSPQALKVTMTKAPGSFRPQGWLSPRVAAAVASGTRTVLYEGPLRPLCPLVPNNVNTMAAAAVAAPRLGFDGVTACLVADPSVPDCHIIDVEVTAVPEHGRSLTVTSTRRNPAEPGHVTGSATRHSFWSSVQACTGHGGCVKLC